ncbi:hypothetical protein [Ktedonobacter sp. SOSP1-52]|uniref:hypothetical protein n=1 Tax=Ktedonobacter sp. SOSP1-52 TaxID=2778366 RepID=UPI0019160EC3|nr:hypothetical protein [Ktedonobacter sp. SOSP1-52]
MKRLKWFWRACYFNILAFAILTMIVLAGAYVLGLAVCGPLDNNYYYYLQDCGVERVLVTVVGDNLLPS